MKRVRAFVVGIDRYAQPGWDVEGPGRAAMAVARWLLALPDIELRLDLFLDAEAVLDADLTASLVRPGVTLHRATDAATLDEFARITLPAGSAPGTRLLVFWSGHGFTSEATSDRIFLCGNYRVGLGQREFNAGNFLRLLRTTPFAVFDRQTLLADVCGVYRQPFNVTIESHKQLGAPPPQLVYFATPEGDYAKSATAGGVFTETALGVLAAMQADWDDHDALSAHLEVAFKAVGTTPFRIAGWRNQQAILESSVGSLRAEAGSRLLHSALALLTGLDVVERIFRPHFLRVVAELGMPELAQAQGIVGALRELSLLRDGDLERRVPHGLLQLMMRLAREPGLGTAIDAWLDREAGEQRPSRREIAAALAVEDRQKTLLIEVLMQDATREIAGFDAFLCSADGQRVNDRRFETRHVRGWDEFVAALQALFADFTEGGSLNNLQIQFAVDTPLFDRPFHRIPIAPGGEEIGAEVVVVLRHRPRLRRSDESVYRNWRDFAELLRRVPPGQLKWVQVEGNPPVPEQKGPYFAAFSLPHPGGPTPAPSCLRELQVLQRLLRLGAPVLYVRHEAPADGVWQGVGTTLGEMMTTLRHLDAFAESFRDARTRGSPHAEQATLLWDDPLFNPFTSSRGVDDAA